MLLMLAVHENADMPESTVQAAYKRLLEGTIQGQAFMFFRSAKVLCPQAGMGMDPRANEPTPVDISHIDNKQEQHSAQSQLRHQCYHFT